MKTNFCPGSGPIQRHPFRWGTAGSAAAYDAPEVAFRIEWRSCTIDVRVAGAGPCVVLVHGYPLDGAMWSSVARRLSAPFRVVKPDLPLAGWTILLCRRARSI